MSSHAPGFRDLIEATERIEAKMAVIEKKLDDRLRQVERRVSGIMGAIAASEVALAAYLTLR